MNDDNVIISFRLTSSIYPSRAGAFYLIIYPDVIRFLNAKDMINFALTMPVGALSQWNNIANDSLSGKTG